MPATRAALTIPLGDREREVPRGDHRCDTPPVVSQPVDLSRWRLDLAAVRQAQALPAVVLEKVDSLRHVRVHVVPALPGFEDLEGGDLELAPAQPVYYVAASVLKDIYEMMSAAPGSDYTEQEFVRDIYLLDASGDDPEVRGHVASLEASGGTRDERKTLYIITRDGQKRLYSTIRFDQVAR